ncbi:MAG: ABC transporter ATP-binding protein [Pseudomonadota bacterium]
MSRLPPIATGERARSIAAVAALSLGQAISAAAAAFATRHVFAGLSSPGGDVPVVALGMIAFAGLAIAACRAREAFIAERIGQHYAAELREKLFGHLSRLPARTLAERRSGGLALRFVGDLTAVRGWISLGIARLVSAAIVLPAALLVVGLLDPSLGLVAGPPMLIGLGLMAIVGWRYSAAHRRLRARRSALAADISERIPNAPELRLLGRMVVERRNLRKRSERLVEAALFRTQGSALMRAIPDGVSGLVAAGILLVAALRLVEPAEAAGALAAAALMIKPMRDLAGIWDRRRNWIVAKEKCCQLLSQQPVIRRSARRPKARAAYPAPGEPVALSFLDIRTKLLSNLSATAPAGRKIAILGANGSGKSSLLTLAAGLEAPGSGRIMIGARPSDRIPDADRARLIAYCSDRSTMLAGTLRRALTLGSASQPSDATIEAQASAFGLAGVLRKLGGLDGRVAEGGRNLSAGEVRRVLLTRAALSGAGLMLLDELDDALDADAPTLMTQLLNGTSATVLFVTHNPAVARLADEAWGLEHGRLVDHGAPGDVLAGPLYRQNAA